MHLNQILAGLDALSDSHGGRPTPSIARGSAVSAADEAAGAASPPWSVFGAGYSGSTPTSADHGSGTQPKATGPDAVLPGEAAGPAESHHDAPGASEPRQANDDMPTREQFAKLVAAANSGDQQALADLRELLDRNPAVWQQVGDLAALAEASLLDLIAGTDRLAAESLRRSIDDMKAKLARPGADYLDELAVSRVVACWTQIQHAETALTRSDPGSGPAKFWLKRHAQADRAYHAAVKSLSTLRQHPAANAGRQRPPQAAPAAETPVDTTARSEGDTIPIFRFQDTTSVTRTDDARAASL